MVRKETFLLFYTQTSILEEKFAKRLQHTSSNVICYINFARQNMLVRNEQTQLKPAVQPLPTECG